MPTPLKKNVCEEHLFRKVYQAHARNLHDFLYYKFGAKWNPADKVQEAFAKLWQNCRTVPPGKAKSYLFTVGNNLMLNEAKHQKVVLDYQQRKTATVNKEDPQFTLEEKEYLKKYKRALANLTEKQRVAFLMSKAEGKTHREIAELLDISQKGVEKRIYGALKKIRKDLKDFNY